MNRIKIGGNGMIQSYCTYGICNIDTTQCLEEGDSVERLAYWEDGRKVVLKDVQISSINETEITIELEDSEAISIQIEDIEDWD